MHPAGSLGVYASSRQLRYICIQQTGQEVEEGCGQGGGQTAALTAAWHHTESCPGEACPPRPRPPAPRPPRGSLPCPGPEPLTPSDECGLEGGAGPEPNL